MENRTTSNEENKSTNENSTASKKAQLFYQILSYVLLIILSVFLFYKASLLPPSKWEPLGSSTFPQIILALIIVISLITLIGDTRKLKALKNVALRLGWNPEQNLVLYLFILLGLYLGLTPLFGFRLSTFVFLLCAQTLLGPKTKKAFILSLIIAVIFSVGMYALFENAFNIYLPRSSIFNY